MRTAVLVAERVGAAVVVRTGVRVMDRVATAVTLRAGVAVDVGTGVFVGAGGTGVFVAVGVWVDARQAGVA